MKITTFLFAADQRNNSGQLLIVGALAIAFVIITVAALSASLSASSIRVFSERSHPLIYEFRDVINEMEQALYDKVKSEGLTGEDEIYDAFLQIEKNFSKIELYHSVYFKASTSIGSIQVPSGSINASVVMIQKNNKLSGNVTFIVQ